MDVFERALTHVLKDEGGYANHPADSGGETYRGIARNFWKNWPGWIIVDEAKKGLRPNRRRDRTKLNERLAADEKLQGLISDFYRHHFWDAVSAGLMPPQVGAKVFNMAVNVGTSRAGKLLQIALNNIGKQVAIDGAIGPKTLEATRGVGAEELVDAICKAQERFYRGIVKRKPSQSIFLKGWLRRAAYRGEL